MTNYPDDTPDASGEHDEQTIKGSNAIKDPDEWTTGSEPMTGAQHSYLKNPV